MAGVSPVYKGEGDLDFILRVIIDQFLSLDMLLDLLNPWCALKVFTAWKVMNSYPMTNLRISNDTLVYTE